MLLVVFDTMVFAYALLGVTEYREDAARVLEQADEVWVPDSVWPELLNVTWQWARTGQLEPVVAHRILRDAQALATDSVATQELWTLAFDLAVQADHPAYDTLFVALAARRATRVATYDQRLLAAFPELTVKVSDLLAGSV